jgi:hypothetical protein
VNFTALLTYSFFRPQFAGDNLVLPIEPLFELSAQLGNSALAILATRHLLTTCSQISANNISYTSLNGAQKPEREPPLN